MSAYHALFFILLAQTARCGKNLLEFTSPVPFLFQLVKEISVDKIVQHYEVEMKTLFNYRMESANSILGLLNEVIALNPLKVQAAASGFNLDRLHDETVSYLSLNRGVLGDHTPQWKEYLQKVWLAAVAKSELAAFDPKDILNSDQIKAAFDAYLALRQYEFAKPQDKQDYIDNLVATRNSFFDNRLQHYNQFLEFHAKPYELINNILLKLAVYYTDVDAEIPELTTFKVGQLAEFLVPNLGFKHLESLAKALITNMRRGTPKDPQVTTSIVAQILQIFGKATSLADRNIGKVIFLFYFNEFNFGRVTSDEYKEFILLKYRRERLKFAVKDVKNGYPELLRLYTLDVLDTSLSIHEDFIRQADYDFIFKNFLYFAQPMDSHLMPYLQDTKKLFVKNGHLLMDFYELFNGLYDTMLLSGPYLVGGFWPQDWSKAGLLFDDFLNRLLKWEKSKIWSWWEWQPDAKHFMVNIKTNYFFYKLVNLLTNMDQLSTQGIKFELFENGDDHLIHKFTLVPEYRRLLFKLKAKLWKGFKYQSFANQYFYPETLKAFQAGEKSHQDAVKKVTSK